MIPSKIPKLENNVNSGNKLEFFSEISEISEIGLARELGHRILRIRRHIHKLKYIFNFLREIDLPDTNTNTTVPDHINLNNIIFESHHPQVPTKLKRKLHCIIPSK
jgi:hypothetical protein